MELNGSLYCFNNIVRKLHCLEVISSHFSTELVWINVSPSVSNDSTNIMEQRS